MKQFKIILWLVIILAGSVYEAIASGPVPVRQFINHNDWNFVENKGQLVDENGNDLPEIKYYGHQGGIYLYCKPGMISFIFTKTEKKTDEQISKATNLP